MAATLPRIGWRSLPFLERNHLRATTEATGFPVENMADWRDSLPWKPTLVSTPPATEYIYCYPLTQTNLIPISNWYFRDWTNGASSAPDGWTLSGAAASVARNSTAGQFKIDQYSVSMTRAGTDCKLEYTIPNFEQYLGKRVTFGAWVRATVASTAYIQVIDDVSAANSSFHSGSGAFTFLTATYTVRYNATDLRIGFHMSTNNTTAQIDGVCLYLGTSAAQTPHAQAADYFALVNHNAGSGAWTLTLQSTTDPADWSSPTDHLALSPTTDLCHWRTFTQASKSAWRLKCAPAAAGSPQLYMGEAAWGDYFELPNYDEGSIDILNRKMHSELSTTRGHRVLGRSVARETKDFEILQRLPARVTEVQDEFKLWWEHAGGLNGRPFFYAWNQGDYPNEAVYAWLDAEEEFRAPHLAGNQIESLRFRCNALAEF